MMLLKDIFDFDICGDIDYIYLDETKVYDHNDDRKIHLNRHTIFDKYKNYIVDNMVVGTDDGDSLIVSVILEDEKESNILDRIEKSLEDLHTKIDKLPSCKNITDIKNNYDSNESLL
jgi:hypothetical protein